ncbi:MAG: C4-type zinc ribbon domain-containing protein [Candidatus Omnitrophota bacterium]
MAVINLEEQMKLLVELQALDTQILKMERELASIPDEIRNMDEEFKGKMDTLKALEDGLKTLQLKRKEKEVELETKEGSIKKLQIQLYQLKTNKEYTAMEQEIGRIKADNSLIEEDIIKIFDQVDAEQKKIAKEKEVIKAEEAVNNEKKKRRQEEAKVIGAETEKLKAGRAVLSSKVDKVILDKYEKIIKSKDGLAVVPVAHDTCQGCFRVLPPQVINEIRMKRDLILCDNCARILYSEE